jgi:predicted transcriptional regulator
MSTSIVQVQQRREQFMANPVSTGKELEKPSIRSELSFTDVLSSICNEKALSIFKAVALSENDYTSILITKLKLTRKQYYANMERLTEVNIVRRTNGKYSLTSFGKVIFSMLSKIETATKFHWRFKAIDTIMMASAGQNVLPIEERQRIIDSLIDNQEIKDILVSNKK